MSNSIVMLKRTLIYQGTRQGRCDEEALWPGGEDKHRRLLNRFQLMSSTNVCAALEVPILAAVKMFLLRCLAHRRLY